MPFAACRGQPDDSIRADLDQTVALEALQSHGHRGRRHLKPVRQHGWDHLVAFGFGFENCLEVILFRYVQRVFHGIA